jgi:hypothetical protein
MVRILNAFVCYLETAFSMATQQLLQLMPADTVPEGAAYLGVLTLDIGHDYAVWQISCTLGGITYILFRGYWGVVAPPPAPNPPEPYLPTNGGQNTGAPVLGVGAVSGAIGYEFRLFHGGSLVATFPTLAPAADTGSYGYEDGETYTWDCRVTTGGGTSAYFSPAWSFTFQEFVAAPIPAAPPAGSTVMLPPTLIVTLEPGFTNTLWRLKDGPGGNVLRTYNTTEATWNLALESVPLNAGTYYWDCAVIRDGHMSEYFTPEWWFIYTT